MKFANTMKIALPFFWMGAVCAISFMEAPLKFNAPNLTTPVALEVGHIVFDALNKLEWVIFGLFVIACAISRPGKRETIVACLVGLILLLQTVWLFPLLDVRTLAISAGKTVPASNLHFVYIVLEVLKVILLPLLGYMNFKNLAGGKVD
ncbi:MAG: hypothetical protein HKN33_08115 [Pyrinomonadaceae bacterium]|nr:hypothetical protein [Pyrinomonadaceae bacterium]